MMKLLLISAALIGTAAIAQPPSGAGTTKRGVSNNANEIVCVKEALIGTRLNHRRVCRTRAEWAQHRSEHKQEVDRAQQQMQTQYTDPGT